MMENLKTIELNSPNFSGMQEHELRSIARTTLDAARRFYKDEKNLKAFEEWKKMQSKQVAM